MPPIIDQNACSHCGMCIRICPMDVFIKSSTGLPYAKYEEECWHCNACVLDCPQKAISLRIPLPLMILSMPKKKEGDLQP